MNLYKYDIDVNSDRRLPVGNNYHKHSNGYWYSTSAMPYYGIHYNNTPITEQALELAIHRWRMASNQSSNAMESRSEPSMRCSDSNREKKSESPVGVKRPHQRCTDLDDCRQSKRLRVSDSCSQTLQSHRDVKKYDLFENGFNCKVCHSLSYSMHDFRNHLIGKRHERMLQSDEPNRYNRLHSNHSLQRQMDESEEPIVGLDFIEQIKDNESTFECKLCLCYRMKSSSAFQHITGHRHRINYINLINPREGKNLYMGASYDPRTRHSESDKIRSLTKTYQTLYGSGSVEYIPIKDKSNRKPSSRTNDSSGHSSSVVNNVWIKTSAENGRKNDSNINTDKKAIETLKIIRELCDKTLSYYSIKHYLGSNSVKPNNTRKIDGSVYKNNGFNTVSAQVDSIPVIKKEKDFDEIVISNSQSSIKTII